MKKWIALAAGLAIVLGVAYLALNNPLGRLVQIAVNKFGPEILQADVRVGSVSISATDGQGKLTGLRVGNPAGFKTDHALKADVIEIVIEPASVAKDVVVIHKVLIATPDIIFEKGDKGSNFDAIQRNVEAYIGGGGEKKEKDSKGESKKMIIDSLAIRGAKVNYNGMLNLSLPDIELNNVGKKTGGATSAQVVKAIIAELNAKIALEVAKSVAISTIGGPVVGAGMAIKGLLSK